MPRVRKVVVSTGCLTSGVSGIYFVHIQDEIKLSKIYQKWRVGLNKAMTFDCHWKIGVISTEKRLL